MRTSPRLLPATLLLFACEASPTASGPDPSQQEPVTAAAATCADRSALRNPYFGDLHVHTSYSFDAYIFETRNAPAEAYAFARGAEVGLAPLDASGQPTRFTHLERPLDFAAATDHSEFLGEVDLCTTPSSPVYDSLTCRTYRSGNAGFALFGLDLTQASPTRLPICQDTDCGAATRTVWERVQDAAADADDPCNFTSFVAYEWTGTTGGSNLHRNVVFRGDQVPAQPVSYYEAPTKEGLWTQLDTLCLSGTPGCDVLAIPHNSNLSNGNMFLPETSDGTPLTAADAAFRAEMEPLVELMQHKGDSECKFTFTNRDEECRFEKVGDPNAVADAGFVREALKNGLATEDQLGANPFRFGFIGSTDTHNGTPGMTEEARWPGHGGNQDAAPEDRVGALDFGPGGLAVVWAEENTRDALFDAFRRRETYATSGTRITLRFFGGWAYPETLCSSASLVAQGYAGGVPMGGVLPANPGSGRPRFVVQAAWDPGTADHPGTRLQRVQIIKGWVDRRGRTHEQVYEVAGDAANGASVDLATCTPQGPGQRRLCAVWEDPDFSAEQRAFYYARVLENPSCRWSTYECIDAQVDCADPAAVPEAFAYCCDGSAPLTQQERATSSPIWYQP
ncbi:MAG: DUF3604 domain-containing protein [Myxococcales bacterium]|nr:DUF3604 domain-containing protein [Myxococcales bacterium]MCB9646937.1 DUF3604 domain-containing protein [Deltaproteobacteria bacterium]